MISNMIFYKYFSIFIIFFLIIKNLKKRYRNYCDQKSNRFILNKKEFLPKTNYFFEANSTDSNSIKSNSIKSNSIKSNSIKSNMNSNSIGSKILPTKSVHYLFWTGGYDSTFRLCQLLIDQHKIVQPIYISCRDLDSVQGDKKQRNNIDLELETMKTLRQHIIRRYPEVKNSFLPTQYVVGVHKDPKFSQKYKSLYHELHYFSRSINQYERLARYAYYHSEPIEIGLEKCGTGLDEATQNFRIGIDSECRIIDSKDLPAKYRNLEIFQKLRFPISHLNKEEMKKIALHNKYYDVLQLTWTCWYPTALGQPCKKCPQCLKRII